MVIANSRLVSILFLKPNLVELLNNRFVIAFFARDRIARDRIARERLLVNAAQLRFNQTQTYERRRTRAATG